MSAKNMYIMERKENRRTKESIYATYFNDEILYNSYVQRVASKGKSLTCFCSLVLLAQLTLLADDIWIAEPMRAGAMDLNAEVQATNARRTRIRAEIMVMKRSRCGAIVLAGGARKQVEP